MILQHTKQEGMARGRKKKEKAPPRKKPPTKKEKPLLAAPLAYGRLRRPPLSLLFSLPSAAAPPPFIALSALFSPLVGGCAAPPLCCSSRASFGRLRRPTPSVSLPLLLASSAAGAAHTSSLSRLFQYHGARLTSHKLFFFCHNNNFLDTIALTF
jgi:hypothetical protein